MCFFRKVHLNRHGWHAADFDKTRRSLDMLDLLQDQTVRASRDDVSDTLREYLACRRDALNITELEELARFREQLTLEQTVHIIQRLPAFLPEAVISQWTDLQQETMIRTMVEDPLLLSSDEDIRSTLFDGLDDWLEAL